MEFFSSFYILFLRPTFINKTDMRKISSLALIILCAATVQAQKSKPYFSGLKVGVNLYTLDKKVAAGVSKDMKINMHGGIFYHIPITSLFSIQPEVMYSAEGMNYKQSEEEIKTTLHYLNIPLMFQVNTSSGFYGETGPQLGILIQGKSKTTANNTETVQSLRTLLKKTAFSWGLGAGFHKGCYGASARYNYGISNLAVDDTQPDSKSSGFQVSLSYWIQQ
jgi:hypothetical protein